MQGWVQGKKASEKLGQMLILVCQIVKEKKKDIYIEKGTIYLFIT